MAWRAVRVEDLLVPCGGLWCRREAVEIKHEDFMEAIAVVQAKKKGSLDYYV